jgi:hypothetical protein
VYTQVAPDLQTLYVWGREVRNEESLRDLHIGPYGLMCLLLIEPDTFTVCAKTVAGKTRCMRMHAADRVSLLMEKIAFIEGVPACEVAK